MRAALAVVLPWGPAFALSLLVQRPPPPAVAEAFLDELGAAIAGPSRLPTCAPVLPDHPRTVAATAALTTAALTTAVTDSRAVS